MKIGIITAMSSEREQLAQQLTDPVKMEIAPFTYTEGRAGENTIILMQSGIGKVNAAVGTTEMILNFQPDCIISTGVAGGIDPVLQVMDVVASSRIVYHDVWCGDGNEYGQVQGMPASFEDNKTLCKTAMGLDSETKIHCGLICTGDKFITARGELDQIKAKFPDGLAVDMESAAIAQVCHIYDVPFISFRIISDSPAQGEGNARQYENFWAEMADRSFRVTEQFLHALPHKIK